MSPCIKTIAALTPNELITDKMLDDLGAGKPERLTGKISEEDQSILAMILPDMCSELQALRRAVAALSRT